MSCLSRIEQLFSPRDMSVGPPWKRILEFAVPMVIGNMAQQLYNTADSIIVGKYIGDNALAAVGSASPILNLMLALFIGISTGISILVAQNFGAKNYDRLSKTIGNCITLMLLVSLVIMTLGTMAIRPMLRLLRTRESVFEWSAQYLIIYFIGIIGYAFYNTFSGILRGLGDNLSALLFLLVATGLNVGLDIWFVASFGLGVPGVALATIIAQTISAVLCLIKMLRMRDVIHLNLDCLRLRRSCVMAIVHLGLPSGIIQAIYSLSLIIVQPLTNSFGEMVVSCSVIVMRVDGFAMMPNFTFGETMATYTGQNVGARRMDRVLIGTRQGTAMALATAFVTTLLLMLTCPILMGVFTDTQALVNMSTRMMRIMAVAYIAVAVTQSLSGVMRGCGETVIPMLISTFSTVVLRVPSAYFVAWLTRSEANPIGIPECTFISLAISWTMGAVITAVVYFSGIWKKRLNLDTSTQIIF